MTSHVVKGGNLSPLWVSKPWGTEVAYGVSKDVALKQVKLAPSHTISRQLHIWKEEIYGVFEGDGQVELGFEGEVVHCVSAGDAVYIPAGVAHRVVAGPEGITIFEASTPEVNDIIRLEDEYGRVCNPDFPISLYRQITNPQAALISAMRLAA